MSSDIDDWRANLWKPYSEVNDDYDGAVFMKPGKGIDMGVNQGDMENCWALVAISGLAHRAPGLLRDMVLYTNDQVVLQLSAPGEHSVGAGGHVCVSALSRWRARGGGCGFLHTRY